MRDVWFIYKALIHAVFARGGKRHAVDIDFWAGSVTGATCTCGKVWAA